MITIITYMVLSFFIDSFMSLFLDFSLNTVSIFKTIYTIIALVIIFNYFENEKKYLILIIIFGILFDIVYTNTFILNIVIFVAIYYVIKYLNYIMPDNILTINIKTIISIIIYYLITYIVLVLSNYNNYNLFLLFKIISHSIIMTIIYTSISYIILKKINVKKIR